MAMGIFGATCSAIASSQGLSLLPTPCALTYHSPPGTSLDCPWACSPAVPSPSWKAIFLPDLALPSCARSPCSARAGYGKGMREWG